MAVGIEMRCPEAGIDTTRCLKGCGVCEYAETMHGKFRKIFEEHGFEVIETRTTASGEHMSTAVRDPRQIATLLHWNPFNGGGRYGEILLRISDNCEQQPSKEIQTFLLPESMG